MLRILSAAAFVFSLAIGMPIAALAAYDYYLKVPLQLTHIPSKTDDGTKFELWVSCTVRDNKDGKGIILSLGQAKIPLDSDGNYNGALNIKISSSTAAASYRCGLDAMVATTHSNVVWSSLITGGADVTGSF